MPGSCRNQRIVYGTNGMGFGIFLSYSRGASGYAPRSLTDCSDLLLRGKEIKNECFAFGMTPSVDVNAGR